MGFSYLAFYFVLVPPSFPPGSGVGVALGRLPPGLGSGSPCAAPPLPGWGPPWGVAALGSPAGGAPVGVSPVGGLSPPWGRPLCRPLVAPGVWGGRRYKNDDVNECFSKSPLAGANVAQGFNRTVLSCLRKPQDTSLPVGSCLVAERSTHVVRSFPIHGIINSHCTVTAIY